MTKGAIKKSLNYICTDFSSLTLRSRYIAIKKQSFKNMMKSVDPAGVASKSCILYLLFLAIKYFPFRGKKGFFA